MVEISDELCQLLNEGGVVAYPTSTLPGLGCLPTKKGLDNLFRIKNRSYDQPVSLGVASLSQASELVDVPKFAISLLDDFPLGSITLILDANDTLDSRLGGARVAVRVFADPVAKKLAEVVGPITATSANPSGVQPNNNVSLAAQTLNLRKISILEGDCPGGKGSTILSLEKNSLEKGGFSVTIMREGVVPRADVMSWMMKVR
ncbi:MAG: Sua5/YciO/YrdC/YwlC family protein [Candidatus Poseidoniales archaeon]|nr:MAG: Sua5/YciO/YrdC/YwlC family protein [Candidatus Poseidoniales archaeon]|tara:strand:- start:698 stop:1306 length:609 start_codon:yes stop_codon:yes gene_type:complete